MIATFTPGAAGFIACCSLALNQSVYDYVWKEWRRYQTINFLESIWGFVIVLWNREYWLLVQLVRRWDCFQWKKNTHECVNLIEMKKDTLTRVAHYIIPAVVFICFLGVRKVNLWKISRFLHNFKLEKNATSHSNCWKQIFFLPWFSRGYKDK